MIRGVNAVIDPLYGITICRVDKNTRTGRASLRLISKVPTIFHVNHNIHKKYDLKSSLESIWETEDIGIKNKFIDDINNTREQEDEFMKDTKKWFHAHIDDAKTKESKKQNNVIDLDKWISVNVKKTSDPLAFVKVSDIKAVLETQSGCINEKVIHKKLSQFDGFYEQKKIRGKNVKNVLIGYSLTK